MIFSEKRNRFLMTLGIIGLSFSAIFGICLGLVLSATVNTQTQTTFGEFSPSLPSQVLDINGNLITEFFSNEKREMISYNDVPRFLTNALITREDQDFFYHNGFSLKGTMRALMMTVTGRLQGGSTLTQQLAGKLYSDRTKITLTRKLEELWWSLQLEAKFTKEEILEQYMNNMPFGHTTYGVEAASQYFYKHSVKDLTVAESALLVIQLVRPGMYSPIRNPSGAAKVQKEILDQMVDAGFVSAKEAQASYDAYWASYDYKRDNSSTAFFDRKDKAPYFSEYIRGIVDENLLGPHDIYKDGLMIHTTLDLDYQKSADEIMAKGIADTNVRFHSSNDTRLNIVDSELGPMLDMLSLTFNVSDLRASGTQYIRDAKSYVTDELSPVLDISAKLFGLSGVDAAAQEAYKSVMDMNSKSQVEGALICLENSTGYIKAMVGGSQFDRTNQFNRAVQAKLQPGSSFKPLYYSAAIDSRKFTAATMIMDAPTVFRNEDGTPYTPLNFKGEWKGPVLLRYALANSMNVPSIQVLAGVGFDAAIDRAAKLLGYTDPKDIANYFPRRYPLALGVCSVSPLRMARAYAIFANQGRQVDPIAVLYIQDRKGNIIANPAADILNEQRRHGNNQVISPQTAYIMTDLLKSTIDYGTLSGAVWSVGGLPMEMAGKTGTTQNWADNWTVGFSPYVTTAIWLGFDRPGNSLGIDNTGAVAAGPLWARFMKEVHKNLPVIHFQKPGTGLRYATVDAETGLLPSGEGGERLTTEIFLEGTGPSEVSNLASFRKMRSDALSANIDKALETAKGGAPDLNTDLNLDLNLGPATPKAGN